MARIGLGILMFGLIEAFDKYMVLDADIPWPLSLIVGLLVGFGIVSALEAL